jgi:hypothetical protein
MNGLWDSALGIQPFMNYWYCRLQGPAFRDLAGKAHFFLAVIFHKTLQLSNPEKWCRFFHHLIAIDTAWIAPMGLSVDLQQIPGSRGSFA